MTTCYIHGERQYIEDGRLIVHMPGGDIYSVRLDEALIGQDGKLRSMHSLSMMLDKRNIRIAELEREVAQLKIGGQPASKLRDAVLPVLEKIHKDLKNHVFESEVTASIGDLARLIANLRAIPSVEPQPEKASAENNPIKQYKPLDHGPRDLAAADPKYQGAPDLRANKL